MNTRKKPRIHPPVPSQLDAAQRKVRDAIVAGPRGEVVVPLGVWLWRPELADRAQRLGAYARYGTCLPAALSELAILVAARFWGSEFEWYSHKQLALAAGVPDRAVEAIRTGKPPALDDPSQAVVYEFCHTLLKDRELDDALYARAVAALSEPGVIDLVGILGYYSLISLTINAFNVPLPEGAQPELS